MCVFFSMSLYYLHSIFFNNKFISVYFPIGWMRVVIFGNSICIDRTSRLKLQVYSLQWSIVPHEFCNSWNPNHLSSMCISYYQLTRTTFLFSLILIIRNEIQLTTKVILRTLISIGHSYLGSGPPSSNVVRIWKKNVQRMEASTEAE